MSSSNRIMIIDDDPFIVNLIREALESNGYSVMTGYDGQMAIKMALRYRPHLIVMDINMPFFTGDQALKALRSWKESLDIPVIFVTGENNETVRSELSKEARVGYLTKPVDLEELVNMIQLFLNQYPVQFPSVIQATATA